MCEVIFCLISFSFKPQDSRLSFLLFLGTCVFPRIIRSLFSSQNRNGIKNINSKFYVFKYIGKSLEICYFFTVNLAQLEHYFPVLFSFNSLYTKNISHPILMEYSREMLEMYGKIFILYLA